MKKRKRSKHSKNNEKLIIVILSIIALAGILYLSYYLYETYKIKEEHLGILNNVQIDETQITKSKTERMLQLEELQKENKDIIGWLEIDGTYINYPVLQTTDNDYYLTHNYKKEKNSLGSLFLDKDFDLENGSSNYLIYGHRSKKGFMFDDLLKYADEDFYKHHTKIKFTTNKEECEYEILSVFYSRLYYKNEKDVFRYYFFVDADNEKEYNDFVNNAKKESLYDTGVTAEYGDQLMTLSTCEYSQEDGRFAVVARKVK